MKYGKLTVVENTERLVISGNQGKRITLIGVVCDCGTRKEVRRKGLRCGDTQSCGCSQGEHHSESKTATYRAWINMKVRCKGTQPLCKKHYKDRNIKVCARWQNSFSNFLADMGEKVGTLSLDRIDNDLGYYPENCRWATQKQQTDNRRSTILVTYQGTVCTISDVCNVTGISYSRLANRIRAGQQADVAVEELLIKYST